MSIYTRHRRFDEILPYTYFIRNKETNQKYHGVRYGNIRLGRTPNEDLGTTYHTSGILREDFKNNPEKYEFRVVWTFDTPKDAAIYEENVNRRIVRRNDWVNKGAGKMIINDDETREKIRQLNIGRMIWITDGTNSVQHNPNDPIPEGWRRGRTIGTTWNAGLSWDDFSEEHKAAYIEGMKRRELSDEGRKRLAELAKHRMIEKFKDPKEREKMRQHGKEKRWYNDGTNSYHVKECDAKAHWKLGRIYDYHRSLNKAADTCRGSKWYNDGQKSYRLKDDDPRTETLAKGRLSWKCDK